MPICRVCDQEKVIGEFYASNSRSCKECVKERVRQNRAENLAYYRSFDRMRYRESEERKENARACSNSEAGQRGRKRYQIRTRTESPEKYRARNALSNAVRDGKVTRADTCYFCEATENLQGHHSDYTRPLDVHWLCPSCHGKLHAINGDFLKPLESRHVDRYPNS